MTRLDHDPHLLAVTPEHFADHLDVLRRVATPLPLAQVGTALAGGRMPRRAVAVTFDDGYADNLHQARPILAEHQVPATVFLAAGHIGTDREFWWDELDRLLLQPGSLPSGLRLSQDASLVGELGDWSHYSAEEQARNRGWHIERQDHPTPRHRLFRALFERLYRMRGEEKRRLLEELRAWAGAGAAARESHRPLTWAEAIALAEGELVELGAHTVTHPVLPALSASEQREEVRGSKAILEERLVRSVASFAYPHGGVSAETRAVVREAGFTTACGSQPDTLFHDADPLELPRLCVRDWDRETFEAWLRPWLGA